MPQPLVKAIGPLYKQATRNFGRSTFVSKWKNVREAAEPTTSPEMKHFENTDHSDELIMSFRDGSNRHTLHDSSELWRVCGHGNLFLDHPLAICPKNEWMRAPSRDLESTWIYPNFSDFFTGELFDLAPWCCVMKVMPPPPQPKQLIDRKEEGKMVNADIKNVRNTAKTQDHFAQCRFQSKGFSCRLRPTCPCNFCQRHCNCKQKRIPKRPTPKFDRRNPENRGAKQVKQPKQPKTDQDWDEWVAGEYKPWFSEMPSGKAQSFGPWNGDLPFLTFEQFRELISFVETYVYKNYGRAKIQDIYDECVKINTIVRIDDILTIPHYSTIRVEGVWFTLNTDRTSRKLTYLLRHDQTTVCDGEGFCETLLIAEKLKCSPDLIELIVSHDDKQRFTIRGKYIRANQGHTKQVNLTMSTFEGDLAYHWTQQKKVGKIMTKGLRRMRRNHVHMVDHPHSLLARKNADVCIVVDLKSLRYLGGTIFLSENGVVLSSGIKGVIPVECLSILDV